MGDLPPSGKRPTPNSRGPRSMKAPAGLACCRGSSILAVSRAEIARTTAWETPPKASVERSPLTPDWHSSGFASRGLTNSASVYSIESAVIVRVFAPGNWCLEVRAQSRLFCRSGTTDSHARPGGRTSHCWASSPTSSCEQTSGLLAHASRGGRGLKPVINRQGARDTKSLSVNSCYFSPANDCCGQVRQGFVAVR